MRSAGSKESKEGGTSTGEDVERNCKSFVGTAGGWEGAPGTWMELPGLGRELPALGRELLGMYSSAETSPQVLDRLRTSLIHMRPRGYQTRDFSSSLT